MTNYACKTIMIIFLIVSAIYSYGCSIKEPVLSPLVQVEILTDHVVDIRSYKLPKGYFRGTLWPSKIRKIFPQAFEIWIISGNKIWGYKELFFYIQSPIEYDKATDVTDDWIIEESVLPKNRMTYLVKRKDESKVIRLNMPFREQHYSFSILESDIGDEIVLFMDISEYVVGNGIFGYAIIKNNDVSID